jgi:hypothetical protein
MRLHRAATPQDRDRRLQIFLAQARGEKRNGELLRHAVARAVRSRTSSAPSGGAPMADPLIDMLAAVVDALEAEGVAYAITGSVASSVYGEPRGTEDADLVVIADSSKLLRVAARLRPRFYISDEMLLEACRAHGFINVIDASTGLKVDLSFGGGPGPIQQVFLRRQQQQIGSEGPLFWLVSVEDLILMKLWWRKDSRSSKQWNDLLAVARVRGTRMDWKYLLEQAGRHGLTDDLVSLRDEAGI